MKVGEKKNQDPSYILGYLLELIVKIWRFEFSKFGEFFWTIFHMQNPLYWSKSHFSGRINFANKFF